MARPLPSTSPTVATPLAEEGLRERKKRETRERIHRGAVEAAIEDGLESLTIDAIAARADISTRTFFNYYRTKEAALLGLAADIPERVAEAVAAAPDDADDLAAAAYALRPLVSVAAPDQGLAAARRRLLEENPELSSASLRIVVDTEKALARALTERDASPGGTEQPLPGRMYAALLATASVGVTRAVWMTRAHDGLSTAESLTLFESGFAALRDGLGGVRGARD